MRLPGIALLIIMAACGAQAQSTRAAVEKLMADNPPRLQFNPAMSAPEFASWRSEMKEAMTSLMHHPDSAAAPVRFISEEPRCGYRLQRWESYPLPDYAVEFLVMIPDSLSGPAAAALCIPGFGQTKELLAGETDPEAKAAMGLHLVKEGLVAVVVDNPCFGSLSDNGYADYLTSSRFLLEMGWSYLGLTSWQDRVVLEWMKTRPEIDPERIIVSGFSLGTEPMMVLGLMDDSIYAFVYNDFLCRTRERALTLNAPDANGYRPFPNSIEHLIPGFLTEFDFPDIVAALAPRPVICTEGGLDRDFELISKAYGTAGAPEAFEYHHYAKFADPASREPVTEVPSGITRAEFFRLVNVDPPHHYYKTEHIIPWLRKLLNKKN